MNANDVRDAKGQRGGLPAYACIELAALFDGDPVEVITAAVRVAEKNEDRIAVFGPFVQAARPAQPWLMAGFGVTTALTPAIENSPTVQGSFLLKHRPKVSAA